MTESIMRWMRTEEAFPVIWATSMTICMNIYYGKGEKLGPKYRGWKGRIVLCLYWFAINWVIGHYRSFKFPKLW